jgi:nucleoid-associated protein YgaU
MPAVLTFSPGNASLGQSGSLNEGTIDPAPLPQVPSAVVHVITPGDTLQSISQAHFGTTKRWPEIANLNNITNADRIREGQKLRLPSGEPSRPLPKSSSQPATQTPTSTTYTVAKGDTLSAIAQKMLGSAKRWREIKSLNGINDPAEIRIGNVLNLPTT